MKALLCVISCVWVCGGLLAADPSKNAKGITRPADGTYVPNPKHSWYAGEVIVIAGAKFQWSYFTDDLAHAPQDRKGPIRFFSDHIVLDEPHITKPKRIPGVVDGVPVLWEPEAYEKWKKTGKVDDLGILFRESPSVTIQTKPKPRL
jgi:hypothetical protein